LLVNNTQFRFSQNIQQLSKKKSHFFGLNFNIRAMVYDKVQIFLQTFPLTLQQTTYFLSHTNHPSPNIYTSTLVCLHFCYSLCLSFFPTLIPLGNYLLITILGTALTSQCSLPWQPPTHGPQLSLICQFLE